MIFYNFSISAASSLGYAYIGELSPLNQRDIMLTLTNAFVAVGTAVVPCKYFMLPKTIRCVYFHTYVHMYII